MSIVKKGFGIFFLAGLAVSLRVQAQPFTCSTEASVTPTIRVEGLTEPVGDIVLNCTGGTPTPAGQAFPQYNFTVTLNTNVTSAPTASNQFNEALLIVDEPSSPGANANRGVLNCGNTGAPDNGGSGPGVCSILSTGSPALSYDATPNGFGTAVCDGASGRPGANTYGCGRPNAFQGRFGTPQNAGALNAITFYSVPIDPPGASTTRTLRFTNLRANASTLGVSLGSIGTLVQATVTSSGSFSISGFPFPAAGVADGLIVGPVSSVAPACQAPCIQVSEGYANTWKPKNISQDIGNGGTAGNGFPNLAGQGYSYNGNSNYPSDLAQNVVGAIYNSESGFEWQNNTPNGPPSPNPPVGVGTTSIGLGLSLPLNSVGYGGLNTGISAAGVAASGTRIALTFSGVPQGASVQVPKVVSINNAYNSFEGPPNPSGVMVLTNTDAAGAGPFSPATTGTLTGNLAVYEVLFANDAITETATIPYTLLNAPQGATAKVSATFAPFYSDSVSKQASASDPVPRFTPPAAEAVCPTGSNGPGANYNPTIAYCVSGLVIPNGYLFCPAGANGPGGIYDPGFPYPGQNCLNGAFVPIGDSFCPAGANGPGGAYNPSYLFCSSGALVPVGYLYCSAGANGPGAIYDPTASSCNLGLVVPNNALPPILPPGQISSAISGFVYSRVTKTYNGTLTLTNVTGSTIFGPFQVFFNGIPPGVTLVSAPASYYGFPYYGPPLEPPSVVLGIPYISLSELYSGEPLVVALEFANPSNSIITLTPVIRVGNIN